MKPLIILTLFVLWFYHARSSVDADQHLREGRELVRESRRLEREMKALPIMQLSTEEFIVAVERLAERN